MPNTANNNRLNLCILSPLKGAYSETFIRNQVELLPFNNIVLNGAELQQFSFDDKLLFPASLPNRIYRKAVQRVTGKTGVLETKRLHGFLKEKKIDIVMAEYGQIGALIYQSCADLGIPLVVHFHGNDASHRPTLEQLAQTYRDMFASATAIVSVSRSQVERLVALGAPREKIFYNCCGADTALFNPISHEGAPSVFLAVGRFVEKKAPHLTIAAFAKANARFPGLRLVMVGDGPLLEPCKQLVKAWRLDGSVEFTGALPPAEVAARVPRSLAFLQHSVTAADGGVEGTPVGILEAGASGVPVISTRHEGIKDVVIEGETGILVDEFDINGMAEAMMTLAADPAKAAAMGKKARINIEGNYSLQIHIDKLAAIISNAYRHHHNG